MPGILDEALAEVVEAARSYEARVEGLGLRLYDEVDDAFVRIDRFPRAGARVEDARVTREVRRIPLGSFPYSLYYVVEPRIVVVAFSHAHRRPAYWSGRLERA